MAEETPMENQVELAAPAESEDQSAKSGSATVADALPAAAPAAFNPDSLPNLDCVISETANDIKLLHDVDLNVKIELGRTHMLVEDVLRLGQGSVVELDKLAGDPVDVYVNEQLVARGEILVLNDNFCVRINEIVASVDAA